MNKLFLAVLAAGLTLIGGACTPVRQIVYRDPTGKTPDIAVPDCTGKTDGEARECALTQKFLLATARAKAAEDRLLDRDEDDAEGGSVGDKAPAGRVVHAVFNPSGDRIMADPITSDEDLEQGIILEHPEYGGPGDAMDPNVSLVACIRINGSSWPVPGGKAIMLDPDGRGGAEPIPYTCAPAVSSTKIPMRTGEMLQIISALPTGEKVGGQKRWIAETIRSCNMNGTGWVTKRVSECNIITTRPGRPY